MYGLTTARNLPTEDIYCTTYLQMTAVSIKITMIIFHKAGNGAVVCVLI